MLNKRIATLEALAPQVLKYDENSPQQRAYRAVCGDGPIPIYDTDKSLPFNEQVHQIVMRGGN